MLSCDVKIILIILAKVYFFIQTFKDINESNGLKLQQFYKQLALEIQIIKQPSRFHHLPVSINMKTSGHINYLDYDFQIEQQNSFFSPSYLRKAANIA